MNRLFHNVRRLTADRKGNVLVLAAASCSLVVGGAGLATDTVQWSLTRRQLQQAVDAAAISGAYARANGAGVTAAAQKELTALAKVTLAAPAVIENAPTTGVYANDANAVRVAVQASVKLPFSSLFLPSAITIPAQATGKVISRGDYCVLALDRVNSGVTVAGNGTVDLGCGIAANSSNSSAIYASGSAVVNATVLAAVGGIPASGAYNSTVQIFRRSILQADPYANLPVPTPTACSGQVNVTNNTTLTIGPGCYSGFNVKGTLILTQGVYYIDGSNGGDFSVGSQGTVTGSGVTIILTSTKAATMPSTIASPNISAGATLQLSAPPTGDYAGVLFYQDRRAIDNTTNTINGNVGSTLQGAVYFPSQALTFSGNSSMTVQCLKFVAKRVNFTGNSKILNACEGTGVDQIPGLVVRLVE